MAQQNPPKGLTIPPWLLTIIADLETILNALLAQQVQTKQGLKAGCDPDCDSACLTLKAAEEQACALRTTLQAHAACCCPNTYGSTSKP